MPPADTPMLRHSRLPCKRAGMIGTKLAFRTP